MRPNHPLSLVGVIAYDNASHKCLARYRARKSGGTALSALRVRDMRSMDLLIK